MKKNSKLKNIFLETSKSDLYINYNIRSQFVDLEKSKKYIFKKFNINNKKILDIGCGTGSMYSALNEKFNIDYTGIDLDKKFILHAKKKI